MGNVPSHVIQATGTRQEIQMSLTDGSINTYSASVDGVAGLSNTDNFVVIGSALTVVRITRVSISGLATSGDNLMINIVKRTTANTGGTAVGITAQPHDSNSPVSQAIVQSYTVAVASLGAAGSAIRSTLVVIPVSRTVSPLLATWDFGFGPKQAITLRGASQSFGVSLLVAPAGTVLNIDVEWTESPT